MMNPTPSPQPIADDSAAGTTARRRVLTGDRPTGRLHLGHYVGSIANRVQLQEDYECYFLIADLHMLTTRPDKEAILALRSNIREMVLDYLAVGIDPAKSTLYLQSAVHAVYEIQLLLGMLTSLPRLTRLPSLKDMAKAAGIADDALSFGLVGYPVLQAADILMTRAHLVPVGADNLAHIEITREIARRFNRLYGEVFPEPAPCVGNATTLPGTDGKGKMSKSLNNAILLSDDPDIVAKKIKRAYTDPNRIRGNEPGNVEGNPVFSYHDAFNPDKQEVDDLKARYRRGSVTDSEAKDKCTRAINAFLAPIRERRAKHAAEKGLVEALICEGTRRTNELADETLDMMKREMGLAGVWNRIRREAEKYRANC